MYCVHVIMPLYHKIVIYFKFNRNLYNTIRSKRVILTSVYTKYMDVFANIRITPIKINENPKLNSNQQNLPGQLKKLLKI